MVAWSEVQAICVSLVITCSHPKHFFSSQQRCTINGSRSLREDSVSIYLDYLNLISNVSCQDSSTESDSHNRELGILTGQAVEPSPIHPSLKITLPN